MRRFFVLIPFVALTAIAHAQTLDTLYSRENITNDILSCEPIKEEVKDGDCQISTSLPWAEGSEALCPEYITWGGCGSFENGAENINEILEAKLANWKPIKQ